MPAVQGYALLDPACDVGLPQQAFQDIRLRGLGRQVARAQRSASRYGDGALWFVNADPDDVDFLNWISDRGNGGY